jgi:3'(2'), 5'-bisphosphate nucleotidase
MVAPELKTAVIALAREAGRATLAYYDAPEVAGLREKEDRSPVTMADEVAHEILIAGLRRLDPDTPVVSEEAEAASFDVRRGWQRFWLVDPLDGTKEFIKRRAEFTVNVALIEAGEPVFGVVLAPALDLLYWAAKGEGAWREEKASASAAGRGSEDGGGELVASVTRAGGVPQDHTGCPARKGR